MGSLAHFDLGSLIETFGLRHFVETGTGQGFGTAHAAQFGFKTIRTCESEPALATTAAKAFAADKRIEVTAASSLAFLQEVCRAIPPDEPALFWLDAHFPGADYGLKTYGAEPDDDLRLPLATELREIVRGRSKAGDVILADDLRIWIDAPFQSGNLPASVRPFCPKARDAAFVHRIVGATHTVKFDYSNEGYIVALPKDARHG